MTCDVPNLSLLRNPILIFNNTVGADESSVNLPITYNNTVIGIITAVNKEKIYCSVWDKFIRFYPEFNYHEINIHDDNINNFKLCGISISNEQDAINKYVQIHLNNEPEIDNNITDDNKKLTEHLKWFYGSNLFTKEEKDSLEERLDNKLKYVSEKYNIN